MLVETAGSVGGVADGISSAYKEPIKQDNVMKRTFMKKPDYLIVFKKI